MTMALEGPPKVDVLGAADVCLRKALLADRTGFLPTSVPESQINQIVESWRSGNPVPEGGVSLVDQAGSLLRTILTDLYEPFVAALVEGRILRPTPTGANGLTLQTAAATQGSLALFMIEDYRVTSFLGDEGVGRTITTMSLLPGEETTMRFKTWRNTSTTRVDTSSVVDSEESAVSEKFGEKLKVESSETATRTAADSWNAEASASAKFWGVASVSASAGATGSTQTSRESFAQRASEQVAESAREARAARKTEITTSTTTTVTTGDEESIDRVLRNVNLRRTLNFSFRELNQEYLTRVHLTSVRFAHSTPGKPGTWTEYPLAELPELLDRLIVPAKRGDVAARILAPVATTYDLRLRPVHPLEVLRVADGLLTVTPLLPKDGKLQLEDMPLKDTNVFVRWKPGPLAPKGEDPLNDPAHAHAVDGVLLSEQSVVMPTGTVIVDAALGEHDALDEFGLRTQEAQLKASDVANERQSMLNDALAAMDPADRVKAYAEATFGPENTEPA